MHSESDKAEESGKGIKYVGDDFKWVILTKVT